MISPSSHQVVTSQYHIWYAQSANLSNPYYHSIPHICHFFSTYPIFGSIFLHAKARKSRQNGFRKNSVIRHKTDFKTTKQGNFFISSHLSCGDMWNSSKFGKNSHFSASIVWKKLKFLCMWRNLKFLHICHVLKSEIFSTWLIFLHLYIGDRGDKYEVCTESGNIYIYPDCGECLGLGLSLSWGGAANWSPLPA